MSQEDCSVSNNTLDDPPSYYEVFPSTKSDTITIENTTDQPIPLSIEITSVCTLGNNWSERHHTTTVSFNGANPSTEQTTLTSDFENGVETKSDQTIGNDTRPTAPSLDEIITNVTPPSIRTEVRDDVTIPIYRNSDSLVEDSEFSVADDNQTTNKKTCSFSRRLLGIAAIFSLSTIVIAILSNYANSMSSHSPTYSISHVPRTTTESDLDRLFRVNDYLSGRRSFDELENTSKWSLL